LLPGGDEVIGLLEVFFATIGAVIPCIDQTALLGFWKGYAQDQNRVITRAAYALVNIIMAHASATKLDEKKFLYYHRSSHLLDMHTVQSTRAGIQTGAVLFRLRLHLWFVTNKIRSPSFLTYFNLSTKPPAVNRKLDYTQPRRQSRFPSWITLASIL